MVPGAAEAADDVLPAAALVDDAGAGLAQAVPSVSTAATTTAAPNRRCRR
jgi:hypothetical protein